jgi:DNA (cytosine-5)-methyltransferase 1
LNAFDNATETRATILIIDGTRVGDVRVYEDQIAPTVISRYGTGGGNVPMIFDNEPKAYSIREDAKADNFSATETDTALALQANQPSVQSHHAQIFIAQEEPVAYDEYNDSISEVHQTLRAGTKQSTGVITDEPIVMRDREGCAGGGKGPLLSDKAFTLASSNFHTLFPNSATVRRLTPTECERLQGFPDGWTAEQADSNRYKQMGNAVAVPVVQWIICGLVDEQ